MDRFTKDDGTLLISSTDSYPLDSVLQRMHPFINSPLSEVRRDEWMGTFPIHTIVHGVSTISTEKPTSLLSLSVLKKEEVGEYVD